MSIRHHLIISAALAAGAALNAAPFRQTIDKTPASALAVECADARDWHFDCRFEQLADGAGELTVKLACAHDDRPPAFKVAWELPQNDIQLVWTPRGDTPYSIAPDWTGAIPVDLTHYSPIVALVNDRNANRFTFAASEAKRTVRYFAGINEEACVLKCRLEFCTGTEAPAKEYAVKLRFDNRNLFWSDAVREASNWISSQPGNEPCIAPPAAFKPLYSTWYCFHQNVFDREIEAECAIAAKFGMKTLIVDDGWQTDDNNRGYYFCGDWQVSPRRFPDMAAHVKRVQDLGIKYMMWYSVPFIGCKSKAYARFKGKYLYENPDASALDPRFPECREYLISIYERALKEWNLDGFKLDFIDAFTVEGREDPAVKENYAGRDIKSVEEATDRLMTDTMRRLKAIKPDLLVEFRQAYIGPAILKYGNMLRVADCPGDKHANRRGIAKLRLTSGRLAVHGDMLEWHPSEKVEVAARAVLDSIFGVVQYSMMLRKLPADHLEMVKHWAEFSARHENALLHGSFKPYHPEHGYPVLTGECAAERIVGVYLDGFAADCGAPDRPVYVINGTGAETVMIRLAAAPKSVKAFDTCGRECTAPKLKSGINEAAVPVSGYLKLEF